MEDRQQQRLRDFRACRSEAAALKSLDTIKRTAANTNENIMPAIVKAATDGATLGEISTALKEVFGQYSGGSVL